MPRSLSLLLVAAALCAHAVAARPLPAQMLTRPAIAWRTLETEHFVFHFPAKMEPWARDVAERMEGVHESVATAVGWTPHRRVTVMIEDPTNVANGFALPFLESPLIFLWPTPPTPDGGTAHLRDWGELLAIHEFAHLAHLTRPSRNPVQARLWRLLPVHLGPVSRRAPRWAIEGYATYLEGMLTGSGRPASVGRAAVLRRWALEGQLPAYNQLDATSRFLGGAMAYLVGSAYLEWLVEQRGPESLEHVWRRMTARADRGFGAAFSGVFAAAPAELYGRFTVEVTARALVVEDSLRRMPGGIAEGELVQRRTWQTGAPAISPDGELMAVTLRSATLPSRLVIWRVEPEPERPEVAEARERARARDPEDVPAVPGYPPPRRALATLHPVAGRGHDLPRFLPDGRVLVVRSTPVGDGTERPDLYIWDHRGGSVRRVTRGAAIREADPFPDGARAAGVRCEAGICDVVEITLATGAAHVLASGSPRRSFSRVRVAPDGASIVAAMHESDRWRLVRIPASGGEPVAIGPDDGASRYAADFLADGAAIVATSERGGIAHLERLELATGRVAPLTRTTGSHLSPAVRRTTGDVFFLALHARGHDVRRVHADSTLGEEPLTFGAELVPGVPPARPPAVDPLPRASLPDARPYGLGPRAHRVLPGFDAAPEGVGGSVVLSGIDPVGRLSWLLQGRYGERGTWQGGTLAAQLRSVVPNVRAELFALRHHPSRQRSGSAAGALVGSALDGEYAGASAGIGLTRDYGVGWWSARGAVSAGRLELEGTGSEPLPDPEGVGTSTVTSTRALGAIEAEAGMRWERGRRWLAPSLALHGASGSTAGVEWRRAVVTGRVGVGIPLLSVRTAATAGVVDRDAPLYEQFVIGGSRPPLLERGALSQRVEMPALPFAVAGGSRMAAARVEAPLLGATGYFWTGSAGDRLESWQRVIGLEREFALAPIAFVALPAVRVLAGAGYSLDEPVRRRARLYGTVSYVP